MNAGTAGDQDILAALSGIIEMQRTIRGGVDVCIDTGLVFLRIYYKKLPESVARRITEINPQDVANIPGTASFKGSVEARWALGGRVANDTAFAQVIRAANHYREKLGYALLGPDGKQEPGPEPEGGE